MKHVITVGNNAEIKITSDGDQMVITIDTPVMTEMTSEPDQYEQMIRASRAAEKLVPPDELVPPLRTPRHLSSCDITTYALEQLIEVGIETVPQAAKNIEKVRGVQMSSRDKETIERLVERSR